MDTTCKWANLHLRFIRHELLREPFNPFNRKKWVHKPLLNFSVQAKVEQVTQKFMHNKIKCEVQMLYLSKVKLYEMDKCNFPVANSKIVLNLRSDREYICSGYKHY